MKLGIIGAMDEEVAKLASLMTDKRTETIGIHEFFIGKLNNKEIVLSRSGIGKVCAAVTATLLIDKFKVDAIVNTGIAGAVSTKLKIADIVFSTAAAYHDYDITVFGYKKGQVPMFEQYFKADETLLQKSREITSAIKGFNVYEGVVLSGDQFISDKAKTRKMIETFPEALVTEMEGAAIAHVCTDLKVPFLVIRSVSDMADDDSPKASVDFMDIAVNNSVKIVCALIDKI